MKKVAVIIVTYNAREYLPELMVSLFKSESLSCERQVMVVDNNSDDQTIEYLRYNYPEVQLMENKENLGFVGGNNQGMTYAIKQGFDYVFLLNQDTVVTEGYLDKLVLKAESEEKIACVQPRLMLYPKTELVNSLGCKIHYLGFGYTYGHGQLIESLKKQDNLNYCSGAACLIKVSALLECGMFNENYFMYHEDLDLGWRMRLLGYNNVLENEAVVYHKYEFSRSIKKYYFMERNRFMTIFQNYHSLTLILILPALILMELGLLLFSFKNGWWQEKFKVYAYFLHLKNWQIIFKTRKKIQSLRKIKDKEVIKDFSGIIEHQEMQSPLISYVANPLFNLYWKFVILLTIW